MFGVESGAAVEDRHFGGVDFDEYVVDAGGVEGCHSVLDGRDGGFAFADDGAAVGGDDVFGESVDDGLVGEVDAFEFVAVVFGGGEEAGGDIQAGVEAFAREGELATEC